MDSAPSDSTGSTETSRPEHSELPDHLVRLKTALENRYILEREIGSGGMATVYLAQDLKHHRDVAIKVLRPEIATTLGAERFLREIQIAARLSHPRIVPLHDSGRVNGVLYYVMPHVEGESLRQRLNREKQLAPAEALRITRQVASALSYAHAHNVIHRDIKPENVLLCGDEAVVTDFGIARAISAAGGDSLTRQDLPLGTLGYMSPEQAMGSGEIDGRSDIYSLGCVLYEMLVGQPPGMWSDEASLSTGRMTRRPPDHLQFLAHVPPSVEGALARSLALMPDERFATAEAFATALSQASAPKSSFVERFGIPGSLALYVIGAVVAYGVAGFVVSQLGLPQWALHGAGALLLAGLPIMATATVVERRTNGQPSLRRRWLTWRKAMRGGALAFGSWGFLVGGYMAMRLLGIGPIGTLVAAGTLDLRERVVLADFSTNGGDPTLPTAVTDAFRVDLAQSPVVTVVEPEFIQRVLARMQRDEDVPLDLELARELAMRASIKAVVGGEINAVGTGFIASAHLVSATTGETLAAVRATAADSSQIIDAINRLSHDLRARIGESLKSIRQSERLEEVTTSSLEALRKYSQATRLLRQGDRTRAVELLRESISFDSAFAMAYRRLGVVAFDRAERVDALTRAMTHQDRLSDRERYVTLATYYTAVTDEQERAIAAYRTALELYPDDRAALNNLGWLYADRRDYASAEQLFDRYLALDTLSWMAYSNLAITQFALGKAKDASETVARFGERLPNNPNYHLTAAMLRASQGNYRGADSALEALTTLQPKDLYWSAQVDAVRATLSILNGKLSRAEALLQDVVARGEQLGIAGMSLQGDLSIALLELLFRHSPSRALAQVERALTEQPLEELEPLDRPYIMLALVYAMAKQPELARATLDEFDRVIDESMRRSAEPSRHEILGLVALVESRPGDAIEEFRQADQGYCAICMLPELGLAHDLAGRPDSAIAIFERYVNTPWLGRLESDALWLAWIYERLGKLYAERGDARRAIDYYHRLVTLWSDADPELQPRVEAARRAARDLAPDR